MSIFKPVGPVFQNYDFHQLNQGGGVLTAGTLQVATIDLPFGFLVTNLYWMVGTTALVLGTTPHYWLALFDSATRALLGQSTDDTAAVLAASAVVTKPLSAAYTTTYAGQFLVGMMVNQTGGTMPTFTGFASLSAVQGATSVGGQKFAGSSSTALGATAPNPAGAITQLGNVPWVGVS